MKLILIHGIAQGGATVPEITAAWIAALQRGGARLAALAASNPELGYYGDLLEAGVGPLALPTLFEQHGAKAKFLTAAMGEVYGAAGAMLTQAAAHNAALPATNYAKQFFGKVAAGQSPLRAGDLLEGLGDVFEYLTQPNLRRAIDERVKAKLGNQPQTIVAHSLGSVVAYRLLRDQKIVCDRLITLGSPLAFASVQALLDRPFSWPAKLTEWRNYYDPLDPICLGRPFQHHHSWPPRITHTPVDNHSLNNHAATGYLERLEVGAAVDAML